jgi:hypothetical protein
MVDITLFMQCIWYKSCGRVAPASRIDSEESLPLISGLDEEVLHLDPQGVCQETKIILPSKTNKSRTRGGLHPVLRSPLVVITMCSVFLNVVSGYTAESNAIHYFTSETFGKVASYICTALYVSSRVPQVFRNARRRSVKGLAIAMFLGALGGNITYACSIICRTYSSAMRVELERRNEVFQNTILAALPYLIGSAGTVAFDGIIFLQWVQWRDRDENSTIADPMVTFYGPANQISPVEYCQISPSSSLEGLLKANEAGHT